MLLARRRVEDGAAVRALLRRHAKAASSSPIRSVDAVILTGGTETALAMLGDKPRLNLFAETGGKNATIVTALSDRDQAIKHVLHSAFSHSGPEVLRHVAAAAARPKSTTTRGSGARSATRWRASRSARPGTSTRRWGR